MERNEIITKLTPICREVFNNPELVLTDSMDATMVDGWTSLSFMHLLEKVECRFEFKFKMMELLSIRNIGSLVDIIASHL